MKAVKLPYHSERVLPPGDSTLLLLSTLPDPEGLRVFVPGCGAGMIPIALAAKGAQVTTCDINPFAVELSLRNACALRVDLDVVHASFPDVLPPAEGWELIAANPPQQPSGKRQFPLDHWEDQAHAGGEQGTSIISELLHYYASSRSHDGIAHLTILSFLIDEGWMNTAIREGLRYSQVATKKHKKGIVTRLGMVENPTSYNALSLSSQDYDIRIFRFVNGMNHDDPPGQGRPATAVA
ncbi:methyltransferase [Pseudarthrobacter sp. TAF60_1]|uniref:methyltransferase n=1 Tax=Pseudarthrobacter sp. TAF60_1 TaxID=3233071 RepID=UPI003F9DD9A2